MTGTPTPPGPPEAPPPEAGATDAADATDAAAGPPAPEAASGRLSPRVRALLEWVVVIVIALAVALFVRAYVVQTYFIPSVSMEPTLEVGDHILVLKAAYRFTSPEIGDVIVFKAPPKEHETCEDPNVQDLVKRIVGLPGQRIWSGTATSSTPSPNGNTIWLQNPGSTHPYALKQPWQHTASIGSAIQPQTIAANSYFVMGDNRPESCDSRVWGDVPRANIVGKAVFIFWPPSRIGTI